MLGRNHALFKNDEISVGMFLFNSVAAGIAGFDRHEVERDGLAVVDAALATSRGVMCTLADRGRQAQGGSSCR